MCCVGHLIIKIRFGIHSTSVLTIGAELRSLASFNTRKPSLLEKCPKCATCGAQFAAVKGLTRRFPSEEMPLQCYLCGLCFSRNSSFKRHQHTHTGEKPFKCDLCGVSFSLNSNLKKSFAHSYWREVVQM